MEHKQTKGKNKYNRNESKKDHFLGQVLNVSVDQLEDLRGEKMKCRMSSGQLLHFSQFTMIL